MAHVFLIIAKFFKTCFISVKSVLRIAQCGGYRSRNASLRSGFKSQHVRSKVHSAFHPSVVGKIKVPELSTRAEMGTRSPVQSSIRGLEILPR